MLKFKAHEAERWRSGMRRMIHLAVILLLIFTTAHAKESDQDQITYNDFTLNIGDRIDIGDYRAELIEIQSLKDGLAVMRVSKVGGALDEQRAFLQNSANDFDGGADGDGITLTVTDILDDQSAKVRVEYKESLGTARKHTSDRPASAFDVPILLVQKSFDKNQISVGDEVKVSVTVKNTGTGQATNIQAEDLPPLPEFSYVAGYPPKIKESLNPGESDSAVYVMNAVKEGSIRVPAIQVSYTDSKKNLKSNNSEPFNILINPKSKADLLLTLKPSGPITVDGTGSLNVSLSNQGKASATRVEVEGEIKPSEGLESTDLDKSYFEIPPGAEENYSAQLSGKKAGNYTVTFKASFQGGDGAEIQEEKTEVVVLEREYKYLYLLSVIPIIIIVAWMYRRYREYKY
jgi:uncharacterized repeat protein (TIGR01451 family)